MAAEALAKLGYSDRPEELLSIARESHGLRQVDARWLLAGSGQSEDQASLASLLDSPNPAVRTRAAYALRHLSYVGPEIRARLGKTIT